ncbi:MAG: sodium/glutamate symporter [Gammaproteobacteria bacterium]
MPKRLITRNKLQPKVNTETTAAIATDSTTRTDCRTADDVLRTILMLAICVGTGDQINRLLFAQGVLLPGFLTAMLVGIALTNLADRTSATTAGLLVYLLSRQPAYFLNYQSDEHVDLLVLSQAFGPMLLVLFAQVSVMTLVAVFIVFRVMGRDYDAAVMSAGFAGLGLGATPVAIGNMQAVTGKYGASPKAFLVVPLVGAFFIDLANALVIKFFIASPLLQ